MSVALCVVGVLLLWLAFDPVVGVYVYESLGLSDKMSPVAFIAANIAFVAARLAMVVLAVAMLAWAVVS